MVETGSVVHFDGAAEPDPYVAARQRLTEILIKYALIDSYAGFRRQSDRYPFVQPDCVLPDTIAPAIEQPNQNTALIFLLDGVLPRTLNKHFRLRGSNRVAWRNIQRFAPTIDLESYKSAHCDLAAPEVEGLLRQLSRLDYALLIERSDDSDDEPPRYRLSHMHVKVERLTDNAIKDLARNLGYIDRRLFERGEDYVDALESKFFEYYGFSANASGRKSAAAIAAQLLAVHLDRFAVVVSSQEDCRLTVLDESGLITQYFLIRRDDHIEPRFLRACARAKIADPERFAVSVRPGSDPVFVYRVRFRRTAPALGPERGRIDRSLTEPWLTIADEAIIPPFDSGPVLPFEWAEPDGP